jgi:hypothetical protein
VSVASRRKCLVAAPTPWVNLMDYGGGLALWVDLFGERNVPQRRDAIRKVMLRTRAPASGTLTEYPGLADASERLPGAGGCYNVNGAPV